MQKIRIINIYRGCKHVKLSNLSHSPLDRHYTVFTTRYYVTMLKRRLSNSMNSNDASDYDPKLVYTKLIRRREIFLRHSFQDIVFSASSSVRRFVHCFYCGCRIISLEFYAAYIICLWPPYCLPVPM